MNKMKLEKLAKKTEWIQGVCREIRNFYENRPPYLDITTPLNYIINKAGRRINEIKCSYAGVQRKRREQE